MSAFHPQLSSAKIEYGLQRRSTCIIQNLNESEERKDSNVTRITIASAVASAMPVKSSETIPDIPRVLDGDLTVSIN
jgi:hypothetical protein